MVNITEPVPRLRFKFNHVSRLLCIIYQAVTLHTDLGEIKIELFCERTPKTCEVSDMFLCFLHCKPHGYNQTVCYNSHYHCTFSHTFIKMTEAFVPVS